MNLFSLLKIRIILPSAFLGAMGWTLYTVGSVFFFQEHLHVSPSQIGVLAAVWTGAYALFCFVLRKKIAGINPIKLVITASILIACLLVAITFVNHFYQAVFICLGLGFAESFFWPPMMGWASQGFEGKSLAKLLSFYNLSWCSATIVAPFFAGLLSEKNPTFSLWLAAGIFILCGILFSFGRHEAVTKTNVESAESESLKIDTGNSSSSLFRNMSWVSALSFHFLIGVLFNVFPIFTEHTLGYSKTLIGVILMVRSIVTASFFFLFGHFSAWHRKPSWIFSLQIFGALWMASLCWFGLSPLVWIQLLSVVVIGILVSVSYTLSIFHSVDGLEKPSSGMAMHELFLTVGILSGALFGGALLEKKGMVGVYAFVALILLVGLLIQFFLYKNREVTNTK